VFITVAEAVLRVKTGEKEVSEAKGGRGRLREKKKEKKEKLWCWELLRIWTYQRHCNLRRLRIR
jgi:hypothetical protein